MIPAKKIIVLNISEAEYQYFISSFDFLLFACPICGACVKYHATYEKKLYAKLIDIHRVMCTNSVCGKTHAIIPSFSVPGCSIGIKELNNFINARAEGKTVEDAGQCFINAGMSPDYPESIHNRLKRYRSRIETIFTPITKFFPDYSSLIQSITGKVIPAAKLNHLCKDLGFNPVLFSRINILVFKRNNAEPIFSLNTTSKPPP